MGATMDSSPVSLRSFFACVFKIIGAYVSGKTRTRGQVAPAMMTPIQKVQLQETVAM